MSQIGQKKKSIYVLKEKKNFEWFYVTLTLALQTSFKLITHPLVQRHCVMVWGSMSQVEPKGKKYAQDKDYSYF